MIKCHSLLLHHATIPLEVAREKKETCLDSQPWMERRNHSTIALLMRKRLITEKVEMVKVITVKKTTNATTGIINLQGREVSSMWSCRTS